MFRNLSLGVLLLAALSFSACDPAKFLGPQAANADNYNLRISYDRGPCYGRCEVFSLDIYDNGLLLFKGERFTERPGLWQTNVDRRRITALLDSFERADFAAYPRAFRSQIPDLAATEFTYKNAAGEVFQTSFKEEAPQELQALDRAIRRLVELPDYRKVSDEIPDASMEPTAKGERQEIIVHLREGVAVNTWLVSYGKQNVQLKERLGPNSAYYLLTTDPNLMSAPDLLEVLRQDQSVISAQMNNKVGPR